MALRISFGVGIKDATTWLHVRHSSRMQFLYRHASVCTSVHHNAPTNHWRTHSHQRTNHRAFAHLARSRDCHMIRPTSQRTPSTNNFTHLGSLMQCRGLSIDVKGGGDPMVYLPTPTECSYELLEYLHDQFVLPWWLTIAVTTFVLRGVFVLPFSIWQQRVLARIDIVQPEINTHAEHIKQQVALLAKEKSWSQKEMADIYSQEVKRVVQMLHYHYKCHSRQIFYVGIVQMGVWTSLTMAVGQMTGKYPELFSAEPEIDFLPEMTTQGMLWFTDLTQTDLILPVILGLVNLTLVELWSLRRGPLSLLQHRLVNWFRLVSVGMIPVAAMLPAAVSFFWLTSSLAGLSQFALLRWPTFRRLIEIPPSSTEMKQPWTEIKHAFKDKRFFSKK